MKNENTMYKNIYMKRLDEELDFEPEPSTFDEPENAEMPPEMREDDEGYPSGDQPIDAEQGGGALNDLRSYMSTLPQDGQVSNQQIIDLGKKYADYFREVKDTIKELQEKQLSNEFEDCLNVKFLPLSKALSNMIDELDAGVADRVHEKNEKAEKDSANMGV